METEFWNNSSVVFFYLDPNQVDLLSSLQMVIEEKPLQHWIDNFYGYGSWQARFWFVSHEDGGGDLPEEVAEKLNYFYKSYGNPL